MWQLDLLVVCAIDSVPNETVDILAGAFDLLVYFLDSLLTLLALAMRSVNEAGELMELVALEEADVHQVDKCAAVFKLLFGFFHVPIEGLKTCISKRLLHSIHEGFKIERERWTNSLKLLGVTDGRQSVLKHLCDKVVPLLFVVQDSFGVISRYHENLLEFLLVVYVDLANVVDRLPPAHDMGRLVYFHHLNYTLSYSNFN